MLRDSAEFKALAQEAEQARGALLRAYVAAAGESTLTDVAERVAHALAEAEPAAVRERWAERFGALIGEGRFLPSVPILSNAHPGERQPLAACFVLEAGDSLDSIYETLARAARIQQGSGGVGIDLSALRPRGAAIRRSGGVSPGPVAFAELMAHSARINALAGRREGAHLIVLADTHPDVLAFVESARAVEALQGAGLALSVSDALLRAARADAPHTLRDPRDGRTSEVPARALLRAVAAAIHQTGNPTLLFVDAIAAGNPVPGLGAIRASNPCGEQPLLPDESCVLGSLVLPAFADVTGRIDSSALEAAAADAVRLLDDVVERNACPDDRCAAAVGRTRKIGLGIMGFADLLLLRGEVYGSAESLATASLVMASIERAARSASERLAEERGVCPAFADGGPRRRNATLLAIAPTGTLRLLAGCNGGIEPWLDPVVPVVAPRTGVRRWVDRWLLEWIDARGYACPPTVADLLEGVRSDALAGLSDADRALLRRGAEVPAEAQLALQARFQEHVDGGVSKTVHLPAATSVEEIEALIQRARALGCKGVAFWRTAGPAPARSIRCGR